MNWFKMQDTIQRFLLQKFTKTQQFFVEILCGIVLLLNIFGALILQDYKKIVFIVQDYYDQRLENDDQQIHCLRDDNDKLRESMKSLKSRVSRLQHEKARLDMKLRDANNMLRILTKTIEDVNNSKTPVKINPAGIDRLLRKKLNETHTTKNSNSNHHHFVKPTPPVTVVQKKEVKKIAPPKGKENISCIQRKLRKSLSEQKEVPMKKLKPNIVSKNSSPQKSAMSLKISQQNIITRTVSNLKKFSKIRKETASVINNQANKTYMKKRVDPKKENFRPRKNLNETFDIIKGVEPN